MACLSSSPSTGPLVNIRPYTGRVQGRGWAQTARDERQANRKRYIVVGKCGVHNECDGDDYVTCNKHYITDRIVKDIAARCRRDGAAPQDCRAVDGLLMPQKESSRRFQDAPEEVVP